MTTHRDPAQHRGSARRRGANSRVPACGSVVRVDVLTEHFRDTGHLSIEEAVNAWVTKQARCWGIHDRSVLAPGYAADLAVFAAAHSVERADLALPVATSKPTANREVVVS